MKTILQCASILLLGACMTFGAEHTWTGKISDSSCGASHKKMEEHGTTKMSDADCVKACIKNGGKYVFVRKGKVYAIQNQDFQGLEEHAGEGVKLTGDLTGDTFTVSKLDSAPMTSKMHKKAS